MREALPFLHLTRNLVSGRRSVEPGQPHGGCFVVGDPVVGIGFPFDIRHEHLEGQALVPTGELHFVANRPRPAADSTEIADSSSQFVRLEGYPFRLGEVPDVQKRVSEPVARLDRDGGQDSVLTLVPRLPEPAGCLHDPALPAERDAAEDHGHAMTGLVEASGDRRELLGQRRDFTSVGALDRGLEVEQQRVDVGASRVLVDRGRAACLLGQSPNRPKRLTRERRAGVGLMLKPHHGVGLEDVDRRPEGGRQVARSPAPIDPEAKLLQAFELVGRARCAEGRPKPTIIGLCDVGHQRPALEGELVLADFRSQRRDGFLEFQRLELPWVCRGGDRRELPNAVASQPAPPRSRRQAEREVERARPGSLAMLQSSSKAPEIVRCFGLEQLGHSNVEQPAGVVGKVAGRGRADQVMSDASRSGGR